MIEVQGVSKRFGQTVALDEVSLGVEARSVLGFLGPNGAGKSTAMKIITTFLAPDAGTVRVDGLDVSEHPLKVRRKIGYMPENVPLYDDMRVHEYLAFVGASRGLSGGRLAARLEWVAEACGLVGEYKRTIRELSKGYRQRTGLAQALIHDPEILILDEPTSGLDPRQIIEIRDLIQELGRTKTIIFSTHILQEVEPVTERVAIINEGRIVADGRIGELKRRAMGGSRVIVGLAEPAADALASLRGLAGVRSVMPLTDADAPTRFELCGDGDEALDALAASLAREKGWALRELRESPFSLEDTFIALVSRDAAGAAAKRGEVRA